MNTDQSQTGFFDNVSACFDQAASFTQHPKGLLDQIKVCNSVYSFKFPVGMGQGYEVISGWSAAPPPQAASKRNQCSEDANERR